MFKLTRMTDLKVTDEQFGKRNVPVYTCDKIRHISGNVHAEVWFDKTQKWRIIDEFGADIIRYDDNGDIIIELNWEDEPSLYRYILSYGDKAEIISPEKYRSGFAKIVKSISDRYKI